MTDIEIKERKTAWVVVLTAITMVVEIIFGLLSGSMSLLADGIHMGSHVLAIGISWLAYIFVRRLSDSDKFKGNSQKILSLSGFTSGLLLLFFAVYIMVAATRRFFKPVEIEYMEAILIACIGLAVNIVSAILLHLPGHTSDYNIRAAYLHVLADALTSFSAIIGLTAAMIWDIEYIDTLAAIISSIIIVKWAITLLRDSGKNLLDLV